jgi:hypothetical protein
MNVMNKKKYRCSRLSRMSFLLGALFCAFRVALAVGGNAPRLDPESDYVARNAVLNARASWPGRLIVQKNTLATFTPAAPGTGTPWELLWNSRPDVAGKWSTGAMAIPLTG